MATAPPPRARNTKEEGKCPVCMEYRRDLVSVDCGHYLCQACITEHCETEGELEGGHLECPFCRTWTQGESFQPKCQLENTVENSPLDPLALGKENLCTNHKKKLNLFCEVDKELMCAACEYSPEHREHNALFLEDAAGKYKGLFCNWLTSLKEGKEKILAHKAETEKESQDLLKRIKLDRESIMSEFRWLHQFLEEQEDLLLDQMEQVEKEIARRTEKHLARLSEELSSLESVTQEMEVKRHQAAAELLQDIRDLLQRCEEKETSENPVAFPLDLKWRILDFSDVNLFLESIMEQFQTTLQTGLQLQKAKVTLEPDTARPQLIFSEDRRGVRWRDRQQKLPDNPERFDLCPYVLGCEGFTAGRHFWEVLVGSEEEWAVGVARKSVRRKGAVFSVSEKNIWKMGKRGNQYWASNSPYDIVLPLTKMLKRIRVTLNCEGGRVAFYNAENADLIMEFPGSSLLGEKIHPLFFVANHAQLMLAP